MKRFQLHVYVIHLKKHNNRRSMCDRLRSILHSSEQFVLKSFTYIDQYDPGEPFDQVPIDMSPLQDAFTNYNQFAQPLKVTQVSNCMKHFHALGKIAACTYKIDTYHIVIEDDVVFNEDIASTLHAALTTFNKVQGVMFLGMPSTMTTQGAQRIKEVYNVLPCCDSYVVDPATAKRLSDNYAPIKFTNNIQMSYLFDKLGISAYLSAPNVFIDGTKLGIYMNSITSNNQLVFNNIYTALIEALAKPELDHEKMTSLLKQAQPDWHPTFLHIKALYESKKGEYAAAERSFKQALKAYDEHGGVYDSQNELLRDFMKIYRHLQT